MQITFNAFDRKVGRILIVFILGMSSFSKAQTIGTIQYDPGAFEGYSIVHPLNFDTTYLIENCGKVVNRWGSGYVNSTFAEITTNGTLIRSSVDSTALSFNAGGAAGIIQEITWDGTVLWEYLLSDSTKRAHHDLDILPNGNLLVTAWERKIESECVAAGRIPGTMQENELWMDVIYELEPVYPSGANIVWEWHAWDHLIQDFDASKNNFGSVQMSYDRMDINHGSAGNVTDWAHINAIHYNEELDHIVMSSPFFNELWMIDHSTTTSEAASSTGGNRGVGGDLLWRWGNPAMYDQGDYTDQELYFQHDCQWVEEGVRFPGSISVFDNRDSLNGQVRSKVKIIDASLDPVTNSYPMSGGKYLPLAADYTYTLDASLFSQRVSGVQVLPNDNLLITSGTLSHITEIDSNEIVKWQYIVPISLTGNVLSQGDVVLEKLNLFKMKRYLPNYVGFIGQDLTPGLPIEENPLVCVSSVSLDEFFQGEEVLIYPNPAETTFKIIDLPLNRQVQILDAVGRVISEFETKQSTEVIDCTNWEKGVYYFKMDASVQTIVIQ